MSRIIIGFLVLFFLGGRPVEFGRETAFFQAFPIPKPVIRIALGLNLEDVHIHASSGMNIYRVAENYKLLAEDTSEVRVGDFLTRGEALAYIKTLNRLGFPEAWIIREKVAERASKRPSVMVNNELVNLDGRASLYFIPANPQSYLNYGGKDYRGIFVLRGSLEGTILINVLNLEDYLKSVVPGELPPYLFGEIEALKAQAIAARTYALKNLGRFNDMGFDLYATPRSQLYEGMSIEHPQSSRAVEETKGEVAVYDGKLINALYTSTCGGATENAEAMFGGKPVPYLKSTECVMENGQGWTLQTGQSLPPYFVGGSHISPKTAILAALGILAPNGGLDRHKSPILPEEATAWVEKAALAVGRKTDNAAYSDVIGYYRHPFRQANLNSVEKNVLLVTEERGTRSPDLGPNPYLLWSLENSASFSLSLDLELGDAVQGIGHEGNVRFFQVHPVPLSNVRDQPSQDHCWQVRTAREDLEARLNEYYPIGELIDLVPRKHGASRRVIELSIIGRESQVLVTGLKIRQVLNLRDNLFVIDRETDEEGQLTHFLFSGKGWGHGVGLCQVGAFRMAQNGATYEEILKKYYRGIKIDKRT